MLTPLDIESKEFSSSIGGYSKTDVNEFMKEILVTYEKMYKENIEMKDKISMLNDGIQYYKTIEETLQNTLILAEKTAEETKASARKKAETIEKEAEIKAEKLMFEAKESIKNINLMREAMVKAYDANKIQIKHFLQAQLDMINKNEMELSSGTDMAIKMMEKLTSVEPPTMKDIEDNVESKDSSETDYE